MVKSLISDNGCNLLSAATTACDRHAPAAASTCCEYGLRNALVELVVTRPRLASPRESCLLPKPCSFGCRRFLRLRRRRRQRQWLRHVHLVVVRFADVDADIDCCLFRKRRKLTLTLTQKTDLCCSFGRRCGYFHLF